MPTLQGKIRLEKNPFFKQKALKAICEAISAYTYINNFTNITNVIYVQISQRVLYLNSPMTYMVFKQIFKAFTATF